MQSESIAQFDDNWLIIFSLFCVRIDAVLCHLMGNKESSLRLLVWQKKHLKMLFHNVICPTCSPSDISVNRNSGSFYGSPERQKWGTKYKLKNIILTSCCYVLHTGEKTDQNQNLRRWNKSQVSCWTPLWIQPIIFLTEIVYTLYWSTILKDFHPDNIVLIRIISTFTWRILMNLQIREINNLISDTAQPSFPHQVEISCRFVCDIVIKCHQKTFWHIWTDSVSSDWTRLVLVSQLWSYCCESIIVRVLKVLQKSSF